MSNKYCFTFGLSIHVYAESENEAWQIAETLAELPDIRLVELDLIEEYDPMTGKIIALEG